MSSARIATGLALVNAALLLVLIAGQVRSASASQASPALLWGTGLEIVDQRGRLRASISVLPPTTVEGKQYPETVILRLIDPAHGPIVKLTASSDGSALGLSDDKDGGLQLFARDTASFVRVMDRPGQVRAVWP